MTSLRRLVSAALFVLGVGLVLVGFTQAQGFTVPGVLASVTAVAALLYAGGLWFRPNRMSRAASGHAPIPLIVFDRAGRIVSGPAVGQPVTAVFPELIRPEVERRSAAAIAGRSDRFACAYHGRTILLDALPVRNADGAVVYGMLVAVESAPVRVPAHV